jgi:hypothetical protein
VPNRALPRSIQLTKQVCDRGPVRYQADGTLEGVAHLSAIVNTECLVDRCEKVGRCCGIVCRFGAGAVTAPSDVAAFDATPGQEDAVTAAPVVPASTSLRARSRLCPYFVRPYESRRASRSWAIERALPAVDEQSRSNLRALERSICAELPWLANGLLSSDHNSCLRRANRSGDTAGLSDKCGTANSSSLGSPSTTKGSRDLPIQPPPIPAKGVESAVVEWGSHT